MRGTFIVCLVMVGCGAVEDLPTPAPGSNSWTIAQPPVGTIGPSDGSGSAVPPPSSVPSDPIAYQADSVFTTESGTTNWVVVPAGYDPTHQTPEKLLVWLHGCGGYASGDIYMISPELSGNAQDWISLSVGGAEGNCWNPDSDVPKVLAAVAALETHFNIDPKRIVIGGYSSGGDLGYRTIFDHAKMFAGMIAENTSPFRDTGATRAESLAAATWKINILHLAHLEDTTYPIDGVRDETDAVAAAGFPITRIERHGGHYDDAYTTVYPGSDDAVPGTTNDLVTYLLPALNAGWQAP